MLLFYSKIGHHILLSAREELHPTSGSINPREHLKAVGLRNMISPSTHGVTIQRGEKDLFYAKSCSIFVGLFQQVLKAGYFDEKATFHSNQFNLVQHPTLPIAVIKNYRKWTNGVYLLEICNEDQLENYECAVLQNRKYNECEEFVVNIQNFK